ncbi:MAG: hypothetical protein JWM90_1280 [Thermoleophilia bacterium]|nr:hypothetical protein [Thermoleophilia bacterium]
MTGFIAAAGLFAALVALVSYLDGRAAPAPLPGDAPRTLPNPGARDLHAMASGAVLQRAPVPSWR